jgi:hypothetical protein
MIKVLVKEPNKIAVLKEIEDDLKSMQAIVGGYIEVVTINRDPKILLICNEEGKLKGLKANFSIRGDHVVGTVFFARGDDEGDILGLEDGDLEIIQELTGITVKSESKNKQYKDDRDWIYFVRAGIGGDTFKTFYRKPVKLRNFGEHAYWDTPWRKTADEAQEDLDALAIVEKWKEVKS